MTKGSALALENAPDAVRRARSWVTQRLVELGRDDLVDSAALGVSELVTNAIIHAGDPVVVQVAGTREHPRIQVADVSKSPPRPGVLATSPDDALTTFGRGLAIVAAHSAAWGSHVDSDGDGKLVWFEPVPEPHEDAVPVDLFDLDEAIALAEHPGTTYDVHLLGMPVREFGELRGYYNELRRELRLLAIAHPADYPLAVEFSEVTLQVERERRLTVGTEVLTDAIVRGLERVDLHYRVPAGVRDTMAALDRLVDAAQDLVTSGDLLVSPVPPHLEAVQKWYLGEFVRQGDGAPPRPWVGDRSR